MTREEAIKELKEDIALYMPTKWVEELDRDTPDGRLITALEMAIKALEAENVLDKIENWEGYSKRLYKNAYERGKAEAVKELADIRLIVENEFKQLKEQVSDVFDKYKAESEEV